jgi:hypothetical protein
VGQRRSWRLLELYAPDITYFDTVTTTRIDGHEAMVNYYRLWFGKIQISRYEMLNPQVVIEGDHGAPDLQLGELPSGRPRCRVEGKLLEFKGGVSAP